MSIEAGGRIALIGGGNMARALIGGLLRAGSAPAQLCVGEPLAQVRADLERAFAVRTTDDNARALEGAALAVLAVKPQTAAPVLAGLRGALETARPVLLSIVAGLRLADLARLCPPGLPIVRAMPNRPALVGAGITALHAASSVTAPQRQLAERVAGACGDIVWLAREGELDVVTALSGSGPAYFFLLAEQLAQAAVELGLEHEAALRLATATLHGSGCLAAGDASLAAQRAAVTSPGGTTEAALRVLEQGGFAALIGSALRAGAARSAELADAAGAGPGA
jgi:pyrroline-5-carboxylate reductase